jgi:hypothetical protein
MVTLPNLRSTAELLDYKWVFIFRRRFAMVTTLAVLGLFVLRLAIPIGAILVIGEWIKRVLYRTRTQF